MQHTVTTIAEGSIFILIEASRVRTCEHCRTVQHRRLPHGTLEPLVVECTSPSIHRNVGSIRRGIAQTRVRPGVIEDRVCAFHDMAQQETRSDREWKMMKMMKITMRLHISQQCIPHASELRCSRLLTMVERELLAQ